MGPYRMDLKGLLLAATANKVDTCHHCLQASNIAVHMYLSCSPIDASQNFANKMLRMKIYEWPVDHKNLENTSLKSLYIGQCSAYDKD